MQFRPKLDTRLVQNLGGLVVLCLVFHVYEEEVPTDLARLLLEM